MNQAATREWVRLVADQTAARRAGGVVLDPYVSWSEVMTRIGIARIGRLPAGSINPEDFAHREDYLYDDPEHVYPDAQLEAWLADAIREAFAHPREVAEVSLDGRNWLITGGMSWGDAPTDSYEPIVTLETYRIFHRAVNLTELRAAIAAIEGPQPVIEE
jgi:hypothetical protein